MTATGPDEAWFSLRDKMTHYQSGTWITEYLPGRLVYSFSMLDSDRGWGAGGSVFTYTNGTWAIVSPTLVITGVQWKGMIGISPNEAWIAGYSYDACTTSECPVSPQLYHFIDGEWHNVLVEGTAALPGWLAFYSISKVSAAEWWAVGKLTTMDYAFLHYKDGTYTVVPTREDVRGISMLPDGTGFARGVGSLLWLHEYPYSVFLPIVMKQ